jgi:phosphoglycolate phosphatase-like HAD superfamily hydrolase
VGGAETERGVKAVAIDLDGALADTRPLWDDWLASAARVLGVVPASLPVDRSGAAAELDRIGAGNWRTLLERFAEDRAAIYLRRDPTAGAALRALEAGGHRVGVFTDAPEPLARVALAQLGAGRRVAALETGERALERLLATLGDDAVVVRSREELVDAAGSGGTSA